VFTLQKVKLNKNILNIYNSLENFVATLSITVTTDKMSKHPLHQNWKISRVGAFSKVALFIPRLHLTVLTTWNET